MISTEFDTISLLRSSNTTTQKRNPWVTQGLNKLPIQNTQTLSFSSYRKVLTTSMITKSNPRTTMILLTVLFLITKQFPILLRLLKRSITTSLMFVFTSNTTLRPLLLSPMNSSEIIGIIVIFAQHFQWDRQSPYDHFTWSIYCHLLTTCTCFQSSTVFQHS